MDAVRSSEMSVYFYHTSRYHIVEGVRERNTDEDIPTKEIESNNWLSN
jgi:hypothetical protein